MEKKIAEQLLDIKAVFLKPNDPFTWTSGIKSPIYCDNRITLSYPKTRDMIETGLADLVKKHFKEADSIFGTATAGIAHAAIVAHELKLPGGYIRSSAKKHGRTNQIEGVINKGDKVVVVEDLISTAGSVIEACAAVREAGGVVLGVVSIFTYGMKKGLDKLKEASITNYSLSNFNALVEVAAKKGLIESKDIDKLTKFQADPSDINWMK